MNLTRRRLLASGAATGAATLAGCSSGCGIPFFGGGTSHEGVIAVEPTESVPEEASIVAFSELPDPEQSLLRTAVDEGAVKLCTRNDGKRLDAMYSFGDRLNVRTSYLAYEGDYFGLLVGIEDVGYAATAVDADVPDGNPCC